jgi:hypothetical protein
VQQYIFRPLAIVAMVLMIALLPFGLAFRELSRVIFDAESTGAMVRQNLQDGQLAAALANQLTRQLFLSPEGEQPSVTAAFVRNTLAELEEDDWRAITALTVPTNLIEDTVEDVVDGYTAWLDGDAALPAIHVELSGWKANAQQNAAAVLTVVLDALPECSAAQVTSLVLGALQSMEAALGQVSGCRPPEPLYSAVVENASTLLQASLEHAPDLVDIGALGQLAGAPEELAQLKAGIVQLRRGLQWGWLAIAALGLLGVLLAARSLPQALRWAGLPLLLAGGLTFVFGLGLEFFSLHFVDALLAGPFLRMGGAAAAVGGALASGALDYVSGPLMLQGFLLSLAAAAALYGSYALARRQASPGIPLNRKRIGW